MNYYTPEGNIIELDFDKMSKDLIDDTGRQGYVYRYGPEQCIKTYYSEQPRGLKIYTKETFEFFKKLNLENFCRLDTEFYREPELKTIGAFTMDYYEKSETSILEMPIEYIIYNFQILYKNAEILAENKRLMHDLHKKNIIIGNDNMTVIDFESFYKQKMSTYRSLIRRNTIILLNLMKALYKEELIKLNLNNQQSYETLEEIFAYSEEPVKTLTKNLKGANKSIDLFK